MKLDFARLHRGVRANNMGTGGIRLHTRAAIKDSTVRLTESGQTFSVVGDASEADAAWRTFEVVDWQDEAKTRLRLVPRG